MNKIFEKISNVGIVPVIKIENPADAVPLCSALEQGNIPIAEITFRTKAAPEAILSVSKKLPNVLLGAGTVLTVEQVKKAVDCGSKFIVSPGFNSEVVKYCVDNNIPITPGCSNPSDVERALSFGLEVVKFFPAEAFGGLKTLKAMSAPYGMMKFIPTGGINEDNLVEYLSFPKVLACGGSFMAKPALYADGDFSKVIKKSKEAVSKVLGFELAHIGINAENSEDSLKGAKWLCEAFNFDIKEGNSSNFASKGIEITKSIGLGEKGHIAIKTNNIKRAIAYLKNKGFNIDISTAKGDPMIAVYLKDEVLGFAIHLLQK